MKNHNEGALYRDRIQMESSSYLYFVLDFDRDIMSYMIRYITIFNLLSTE